MARLTKTVSGVTTPVSINYIDSSSVTRQIALYDSPTDVATPHYRVDYDTGSGIKVVFAESSTTSPGYPTINYYFGGVRYYLLSQTTKLTTYSVIFDGDNFSSWNVPVGVKSLASVDVRAGGGSDGSKGNAGVFTYLAPNGTSGGSGGSGGRTVLTNLSCEPGTIIYGISGGNFEVLCPSGATGGVGGGGGNGNGGGGNGGSGGDGLSLFFRT